MEEKMEEQSRQLEEYISVHSVDISSEDRKEIEAQISGLSHKYRISLSGNVTPLKKELFFPIMVNILVFGIAAAVLFFASRIFNPQRSEYDQIGAFSSVEGNLLRQLRQDSEALISDRDREIANIRAKLRLIELQKQQELQAFDAQLGQRQAAYQEQVLKDVMSERDRLAARNLPQSQRDAMLEAYELKRYSYYQQQLKEERDAIQKKFNQIQTEYHKEIQVLNSERRSIQAEVQRQEIAFLQTQEQIAPVGSNAEEKNAGISGELQQAREEILHINDTKRKDSEEEIIIVAQYQKIHENFANGQFAEAITNSDFLLTTLRNGTYISSRRNTDIYLADSLNKIAHLELEKQQSSPRLDPQSIAYIANLETSLKESNRQLVEYQDAFQSVNEQLAAEKKTVDKPQSDVNNNPNLAAAVNSFKQARGFAEQNNVSAAIDAYRQAGNLLGLSSNETASLIAGIETLRKNAINTALIQQKKEMDQLSSESETLLRNRILLLESALHNLRQSSDQTSANNTELTKLQTRLRDIQSENTRLKKDNEKLSDNILNQNTDASRLLTTQNQINVLESENVRLKQENEYLTLNSSNQNTANMQAKILQNRIDALETENTRLKQANNTLSRSFSGQSGAR